MSTESNIPNGSENPKKKSSAKPRVPKGDDNLSTTTGTVSKKWLATPAITMLWKTSAEFALEAEAFINVLDERNLKGSDRPSVTKDLKTINKKLDEGIEFIKSYLVSEFGKANAGAYFSKFGIEKVGTGYRLPNDRDKRKNALKLLVPAIVAQGFEAKPYGKAYFEPLVTDFNSLATDASDSDGGVSSLVGNKNAQKAEVLLVLKSLIKIIEGNYPKTYKSVLREWGFQKEKY